jgi:hypothetical protein
MTQTAQPSVETGVLRACEFLLAVHGQSGAGGVLAATVEAGMRLGAPFALAYLPYDRSAAAWHLTTLLAPDGAPVSLDRLEVPLGPIRLDAAAHADGGTVLSLEEVFGSAWGAAACQRIAQQCDIRGILVRSSGPAPPTSGKLTALLRDLGGAPLIWRLTEHAVLALARTTPQWPEAPDCVLPPDALLRHLHHELARAERYQRHLAVIYIELASRDEVARMGPLIGHELRRWDAIGRVEEETSALVAVLPETSELEALRFVKRNADRFGDARPGVAAFPDRGPTPERLLAAARARSAPDRAAPHRRTGETWIREGSAALAWHGRLPDQVRCPGCSALYLHPRGGGASPTELRDQRLAAYEALAATCPDHAEQVVA